MKKDSILNSIYYGRVKLWESSVPKTKEYTEDLKKSMECHDKLLALLDDNGWKAFNEYLEANAKATSYFEEEKFKDGFILGARLMIEILGDERFM